jgi:dTDP-4-dehydrorhamnose reductase
MGRRLLLTGATGFLGRRLAAAADGAGWEVVAPSRRDADLADPGAGLDATLDALVAAVAPAAVVHTAYVIGGPSLEALTARAPARLAGAVARTVPGARFVHVSSDVVFGGRAAPYTTEDRPDPVHPYGRAKAAAEAAVAGVAADRGLDVVWVRTSLLIGDPTHGPGPQEALAADPDVRFFVDEWRRPIRAIDVAAGIVRLLEPGAHRGPVHLVGPELLARDDLARRLAPRGRVVTTAHRADVAGDRPGRLDLTSTALEGWDPAPISGAW